MPHIRPYRAGDFDDVRSICQKTDSGFAPAQRETLWCLYCDYYIEQEPQNTLLLANDADRAVGYLLLAANWARYRQVYAKKYLPRLKVLDKDRAKKRELDLDELPKLRAEYPAHLHINILPGCQGQGWGARLMDAGCQLLRQAGCPGLMLGVDTDNPGAIRFYERYGFAVLQRFPDKILYGLKL